jgi:capsular exopolysaccharide synthesis family protein
VLSNSDGPPPPAVLLSGHHLPPATAIPPILDAEFSEAPPRHVREYLRLLYKYRWLAFTCFGITLGIALLLTLLAPRRYTAATRLQVASQSPIQLRLEGNVLDLEEHDRNVNGTSSFLSTQVAALKSRDLAERVIRTRGLADNPGFLHPGVDRRGLFDVGGELLGYLRPRGIEARAPAGPAAAASSASVDPELLDRYLRYLDVRDVRGTDLIEIRFTTPSPSLSAVLAAAHTQAYLESNQEAQLATDVTAKDFLDRQLRTSRTQVERAESELRVFATENPSVAINQEQKVVAEKTSQLSDQLTQAQGQRVSLESRYQFLTRPDADPAAFFLDRAGIQKLHLALLDLGAARAGLDGRLGPNHLQMLELRRQEEEIAQQLRAEVDREVVGVRAHYDAAAMRERSLRATLQEQEDVAIGLRELGARYDMLKGDVETAKTLHASLLKQQMETAVNSALAASNIRIIERAEVPHHPSTPNVPMNLILGFGAGLIVALGATFTCDYFDNSVKSSDEVESLLQLPALATIPNFTLARRSPAARALSAHAAIANGNGSAHGAGAANGHALHAPLETAGPGRELVVLHEPLSPVAEAFRALRTAVLFSSAAAPPKMLLVTSAGAGEGKTVSSLNLATTLAEAGSRVLLMDVDLRKPSCHRALGIRNDRGLSSYLAGLADLASVTHALERPRIAFIPAGPTPPNPAELIGSARMRETLEELHEAYDFLILDSPPVLPVTDSVVLAREVDGVILVVKGHDTPRELIRRARDQLVQANTRLLGAVINNVDLGWGDLYFYNRYYGYYRHPAALDERERVTFEERAALQERA